MRMVHWKSIVAVGVLAVVAGAVALAFPLPASLTVNAFVGGGLAVAGMAGLFGALRLADGQDRMWGLLLGLAMLFLGIIMLSKPLMGLRTLTFVLAVIFLASGLFKLMLGLRMPQPGWKWPLLLSGAVSVLLSVMIVTGLPSAALVVPGILLAVELLAYGWGLIFLGLAWRERGL